MSHSLNFMRIIHMGTPFKHTNIYFNTKLKIFQGYLKNCRRVFKIYIIVDKC